MTAREPKTEPNSDTQLRDVVCKFEKKEGKKQENNCSPNNTECEPNTTTEDKTEEKATTEIRTKDERQESGVSCPDSSSGFKALKKCHYEGCIETTERCKVKAWLCKRHRNKLYKDTYKKKKNESPQQQPGAVTTDLTVDNLPDCSADEPPIRQCNMLEQVLNEKKLALLQSPEVQEFFRQQQQKLSSSQSVDTT